MRSPNTWIASLAAQVCLALLGAGLCSGRAEALTIRACSDQSDWSPLIFVDGGTVRGMHVDLIHRALTGLGHDLVIQPMPWMRCLLEAERGTVDAVATAVFNRRRALYLRYPADATETSLSRWAVAHVDDVLVTFVAGDYRFDGDLARLPQPVRAPRGWDIGDYLSAAGVAVDASAPNDDANLAKLLRDRTGSVAAVRDTVLRVLQRPPFAGQLLIHERALRSKSYFLPFSKRSRIDAATIQAIWNEIARLRDDPELQAELRAEYAQLEHRPSQ